MSMLGMAGRLKSINIPGSEYIEDAFSKQMVLHVSTSHALIQAAGYLKYIGGKNNRSIFFRGQERLYNSLTPSLFRGVRLQAAQANRISLLKDAVKSIVSKNKVLNSFGDYVHEPLLQHYGLRTSWVDLVDNIWVALWFSCHTAHGSGALGEYLHFERRNPNGYTYDTISKFAYVFLVTVDNAPVGNHAPGLYKGASTELIDLRIACPSIFLRPHAQHGVLFRMRGNQIRRPIDYSSQVLDIVRINLDDALTWLGQGITLGTHALFPPPYYDTGYGYLLNSNFAGNKSVGSIQHIGS